MYPRGEYLENYRCADGCQMLNTSTKTVYVTQLIDVKYIGVISKVPNLSIEQEISFWRKRMVWCGVIYHEGEQSHSGRYISGVKVIKT